MGTFLASLWIHNRKELSKIKKLNYLVSLLQGEVAESLGGYALTGENYEDIIKTLKDRYGNTEIMMEHHIRKLLSVKWAETTHNGRSDSSNNIKQFPDAARIEQWNTEYED